MRLVGFFLRWITCLFSDLAAVKVLRIAVSISGLGLFEFLRFCSWRNWIKIQYPEPMVSLKISSMQNCIQDKLVLIHTLQVLSKTLISDLSLSPVIRMDSLCWCEVYAESVKSCVVSIKDSKAPVNFSLQLGVTPVIRIISTWSYRTYISTSKNRVTLHIWLYQHKFHFI